MTIMLSFLQVLLLSLTLALAIAKTPNYLLIGNSYIGENSAVDYFDPVMEDGTGTANSQAVWQGGQSFAGHLANADGTNGDTELKLTFGSTQWDWVVLQEQSQISGYWEWDWEGTSFWRSTQSAIGLNNIISAQGGETMFLMTWGRRDGDSGNPQIFPDFLTMQDYIEEGYKRYKEATSTSGRPTYIAPVGLVHKTIYYDVLATGVDPTDIYSGNENFWRLYRSDGSHPTPRATYVIALTLYTSITGNSPLTINWRPRQLSDEQALYYQDAVYRTIVETLESGEYEYPWTTLNTATPVPTTAKPTTPPVTASPTTKRPTAMPTTAPFTASPTSSATKKPTVMPTTAPVMATPTKSPTKNPTAMPTTPPVTVSPTKSPTKNPTRSPTASPSLRPSSRPSTAPPTGPPSSTATEPTNQDSLPSLGSLTIEFNYNESPEEISWIFAQKGSETSLHFQPFSSNIQPHAVMQYTFDNLEPGAEYYLKIADSAGDGIWDDILRNQIRIYDDIQEKQLGSIRANFESYYEIKFLVQSNGFTEITDRLWSYQEGTWKELDEAMRPIDMGPTGSITFTFDYDEKPEEISWIFAQEGSDSPLYYLPFSSKTEPHATIAYTFDNLEPGLEYYLKVADSAGDGIWDDIERNQIKIYDDVQDKLLGSIRANFENYYEIRFMVQADGFTIVTDRSWEGSWEELESKSVPSEIEYPGLFPQDAFSIMINMVIETRPEDLSYTLYRSTGDSKHVAGDEWLPFAFWDGSLAVAGTVGSTEYSDLYQGWYRLVVQNKAGTYLGNGWFSVTGPIGGDMNGEMGLVWGNQGQFPAEENVFFRYSTRGWITHIRTGDF